MLKRIVLILPLALCVSVAAASAASVRVKINNTPMRASASTTAEVVLQLKAGTVLDLLDASRDWYKVRDPQSKKEGFVQVSAVELQPGPAVQGTTGQKPAAAGGTGSQSAKPATAAKAARPPSKGDWTDRGYFSIGGFYETGVSDFTQTQSWLSFAEPASATITYPAASAAGFDVEGGYRVWRNMAVGVGITAVSRSTMATVSGTLPNPLYLDRPIALSGGFESSNSQVGIHLVAAWVIPVSPKINLTVFGGPSIFAVTQTIVEAQGIALPAGYPFESGVISSAKTTDASKTAVGFGAGADVSYFFSKAVGVGGMVRYARAPVSFDVADQPSVEMNAGGFQVGGGLRIRIPAPRAASKPPAPPKPQPKPEAPKKK
jgi:hypothetical protein